MRPRRSAEYGAQFRTDIGNLVAPEALARVVVRGRQELPPVAGVAYVAFVDPSGGSADSMTLGIAHAEGEVLILDALRECRPPFSPERVASDFADVCKRYAVRAVTGDRYGGEWPREQFRKHGVQYDTADASKSELYLELLPLLNSRRLELLDDGRLVAQLGALERRTGATGRDIVDHPPGAHDDLVNAAAGALVLCARSPNMRRLPSVFTYCARESAGLPTHCVLWGGPYLPSDPVCAKCPGWIHVKSLYTRHIERGSDPIGLRAFASHVKPNEFTSRKREDRGIEALFL